MKIELFAAVECHADPAGPGRLTGTLVVYGEPTRDGRAHVFMPGSLKWDPAGVVLNRQHQRGEPITRIVPTVDGDRVTVDHVLPDTRAGRDAAAEVRSGLFRGLSVETAVRADRHVAGRREITAADLVGVGLVDRAAFAGSTVTVHGAQGGRRRVWL